MGKWAELPEDLLVLTAQRLILLEDFLSFSGVCRSWRSVAINDNFKGSEQTPWLMLARKDKPDDRQFISLRKGGVIRTVNLPEARGTRCLESLGWLVTISQDGDMNLLHPFTRVQINLPQITKNYHLDSMKNHLSFVHKAVLSSRPEESNDYALVVIYGCSRRLAFWRPGDKSWTGVHVGLISFCDINFYKGLCYGVISNGMVLAFDVWGLNPPLAWHVGYGAREFIGHSGLKQLYVVQSADVVLIVIRDFREACLPVFLEDDHLGFSNNGESRVYYATCGFKVFEVGECVEKTSLGDNALFLGDNSSVSVVASRFRGIKSNCIYYTNNFKRREGNYMCIYNMEDGSHRPCYEEESSGLTCPPMWVNPS
ncbi:hypothetical protein RHSIM_Rhsim02G0223700 [Rhododendron simsii]|uniref:KIB1-4 beta-propeller domain-containing protein n=1 Tax=Rhododendron simsii TaxID=118357 RepID=A0A834HFQ2_RHOSS|nr:hypothetical protein RHSIM_Rhsim02G0223700 [Rhododendron simsii]